MAERPNIKTKHKKLIFAFSIKNQWNYCANR